jgi:hypothetical protein
MSDNPESPTFNRKNDTKSTEEQIESFSDVSFWSTKPAKIDIDDIKQDVNNTTTQLFEDDGTELVPIKEILPDALEFKGLGVNGTVRRYQRSSPIPVATNILQVEEQVPSPPKPAPEPPKIKRSISKNFVKDATERELKVVVKKEAPPVMAKEEQKIRNPRPIFGAPLIKSLSSAEPARINIVHNNFYYHPQPVDTLATAPYLSPRVLESMGRSEQHHQQQIAPQKSPVSSQINKNAPPSTFIKKQALSSPVSAAPPTVSPSLLDKRGDTAVSSGTLSSIEGNEDDCVSEESSHQSEKFWFKMMQIFRSVSMAIHTWITTWPGLQDPRVAALNGKGLLIAVLTFSMFDVFLALIKAFPKNFWCCWQVRKWDPVSQLSLISQRIYNSL